MDSKKRSFLQKQKDTYRQIWSPYLSLKRELETCDVLNKEKAVLKLEKLKNRLACFRWKIWHFEHTEESLGRQVKTSFQDLRIEIDWRMEAVKMTLQDRDLSDEEEEKRLERIYAVKK